MSTQRAAFSSRTFWVGLSASGFLLGVARPLGVLWLGLTLAVAVAFLGPRHVWRTVLEHRAATVMSGLIVGGGAVFSLGWEVVAATGSVPRASLPAVLRGVPQVLPLMLGLYRNSIGAFGPNSNIYMPRPVLGLWASVIVAAMALAWMIGTRRDRLLIAGFCVCAVVGCTLLVSALGISLEGSPGLGIQGRYFLPVVMWLSLLPCSMIGNRIHQLNATVVRRLVSAALIVAAIGQGASWWINAQRYAVGTEGPLWFPPGAGWSPPGGWTPWVGVCGAGTLALLLAALIGLRPGQEARRTPAPAFVQGGMLLVTWPLTSHSAGRIPHV